MNFGARSSGGNFGSGLTVQILRLLGGNFGIAIATCFLPRVNGTYFESGRAICTSHFLGSHLGSGLVMRMARLL